MKVAHNDEAANNCDNAPELDLIVTLYATGEIVGNSAMKFYHYQTGDCDGYSAKEPAPTKCPLHGKIIAQLMLARI